MIVSCSGFQGKTWWVRIGSILIAVVGITILLAFCVKDIDGSELQNFTVQDLLTQKFPHLTSADADLDPRKADIFEGDIIISRINQYPVNPVRRRLKRKGQRRKDKLSINQHLTKHRRRKHELRHQRRRYSRAATARKERLWRHGVIPFEIEANFSGERRTLFKQAMRYWENNTCVQFVERTSDHSDYIYFTQRACGCCSFVGRRGNGAQAISIGKNCDKFGIVAHELGHVIGFWHEHTRPDRDRHVEIITKNIMAGQEYNFNKLTEEEVNSLGLSYDYDSIMHYARNTFSKSTSLDTILPKAGFLYLKPVIGQRIKLSDGDIAQTNKLYKCPKCGRTCQEPSGLLRSPGYERSHGSSNEGDHCEWRISATYGEKIVLNITSMNIFSTPSCDTDYLEVRDGYWSKSRLLGRFCGSSPLEESLSSTGHKMVVTYKASPGHFIYKGFEAKYEAVCGGNVNRDEGILQSPNYPDEYRADKECIWTITVSKDYQVALTFQSFEVENHDNCAYDFVEVRDGLDLLSPLLAPRLCGFKVPEDIRSTSNKMLVRFVSDSSVQKMGFSASFVKEKDECQVSNHGCQQVCVNTVGSFRCECSIGYELHSDGKKCEDACGGVLSSASGSITSPSFPDLYPANKICVWQIVASPTFTVTLNFTHFDLEGTNQECEYDSIEISSTDDELGEKKHGTFCGSRIPPIITSIGRSIKIEFVSDNSVQKSGFAAVYFTDKDECATDNGGCQHICKNTIGSYECSCHNGFILHTNKHDCKEGSCVHYLTSPRGVISSPNYPENYPSRKECTWHFNTTPGHRIKLLYEEFELESHQECAYDYVVFYDGGSSKAPLLGKFCGSKIPHPIVSTRNEMLMTFRTDPSVQKKGFKAMYTTVCGGRLTAMPKANHLLSHAKFGDQNYENRADCNWFITALDSGAIRLHFDAFELEEEKDCAYDFVEVYDDFELGFKLGKFCGNKMPPEIISKGPRVLLRFQSDDTITFKGFSITFQEIA